MTNSTATAASSEEGSVNEPIRDPSRVDAPIKFIQASKYHMVSECGRYTIDKASVGENVWRYLAWFRSTPPEGIGDACDTAAEAQQLCVQHAATHATAVQP